VTQALSQAYRHQRQGDINAVSLRMALYDPIAQAIGSARAPWIVHAWCRTWAVWHDHEQPVQIIVYPFRYRSPSPSRRSAIDEWAFCWIGHRSPSGRSPLRPLNASSILYTTGLGNNGSTAISRVSAGIAKPEQLVLLRFRPGRTTGEPSGAVRNRRYVRRRHQWARNIRGRRWRRLLSSIS